MNLFADLPTTPLAAERVDALLRRPGIRIERIVSTGQASPDGFWYDQDEHEWVLLLSGDAEIEFATGERVRLAAGDSLEITARCRHRVRATAAGQVTLWLAVFFP